MSIIHRFETHPHRSMPVLLLKRLAIIAGIVVLSLALSENVFAQDTDADGRCYELRTYTAPEGELDDLNRRFRKYSRIVFSRYQMDPMGFWIPLDNPENQFTYLLAYAECADRDPAWKAFQSDSLWQRVEEITTHDGDIVSEVTTRMMKTTAFSPPFGPSAREADRIFELRTYTALPGKRDDLLARFRNHTMGLFTKHGMENVAYWLPQDSEQELVYMLAFPSRFARNEAWREFEMDPEWQKVFEESREDGPLVKNVESTLLRPTDYSPIR